MAHIGKATVKIVDDGKLKAAIREHLADAWDQGKAASDCECGHSIVAHPKDDWRQCRVAKRGECGCTGFAPVRNPYRVDQ